MSIFFEREKAGGKVLTCDCIKGQPYFGGMTIQGCAIFRISLSEDNKQIQLFCTQCRRCITLPVDISKIRHFALVEGVLKEIKPKQPEPEPEPKLPPCPVCKKDALILFDAVDQPFDLQCSNCQSRFISAKVFGGVKNEDKGQGK